jgi:hypothetical protein
MTHRPLVMGCAALALAACGDDEPHAPPPPPGMVVVTFNTGTNDGLGHDGQPDDGYGSAEAALADDHYGNGLSWRAVVEDVQAFFAAVDPDVVVFQEIFYSGECPAVHESARAGFVCETWQPGDPTVAEVVLGAGFQVACHVGHPDKCAAVNRRLGTFRGCDADLCLEGLDGAEVPGCGSGSRVGRGVIELAGGGELVVVNVHGSSGVEQADQDCRAAQFAQVFVDLGDGEPAANGARNLVMGDFNTDPARLVDIDESAQLLVSHVGEGKRFHFVTSAGLDAQPTYAGLFNIDHVISDALGGSCWHAGITDGHPPVTDMVYFDHRPAVCTVDVP